MKAIRSIKTTVITEMVGSLVINHGIKPNRARPKKYLSIFGGFLKPYFKENKNIISVKISETPVAITAIPAPFASCPKKTTQETIVQTNQV
jgi:hypothetical protein